jgi:hypothetical protein
LRARRCPLPPGWMTRTRGRCAARPSSASPVPSGDASSMKTGRVQPARGPAGTWSRRCLARCRWGGRSGLDCHSLIPRRFARYRPEPAETPRSAPACMRRRGDLGSCRRGRGAPVLTIGHARADRTPPCVRRVAVFGASPTTSISTWLAWDAHGAQLLLHAACLGARVTIGWTSHRPALELALAWCGRRRLGAAALRPGVSISRSVAASWGRAWGRCGEIPAGADAAATRRFEPAGRRRCGFRRPLPRADVPAASRPTPSTTLMSPPRLREGAHRPLPRRLRRERSAAHAHTLRFWPRA